MCCACLSAISRGVEEEYLNYTIKGGIVMVGVNALNIEHLKNVANGNAKVSKSQRRLARIKLYILEKDGFACRACGATEGLSIDHIFRVREIIKKNRGTSQKARWGTYKDFCQVLCLSCHHKKNKIDNLLWLEGMSEEQRRNFYERTIQRLVKKHKTWPTTLAIPEWFKNNVSAEGKINVKTPVETKA